MPAFVGLGAPYWDPYARGAIYGITRGTTKAHLVRATLEAMAYQTADVLEVMQNEVGQSLSSLRVDGGGSANDILLAIQADLLGVPVVMIRTYGSFSRNPLYNNLKRRKVKVSADMEYILSPDEIKEKSAEEINEILRNHFDLDYFSQIAAHLFSMNHQ